MKAATIAPFIFLLHPIGQTVITRVIAATRRASLDSRTTGQ
ncbi:hypothetical protein LMG24238_06740 [Paraburkholderia sediminicola]|uniref:Uncharacterized protein n=1 Tax=Paraburkholderia sediminicola TaxID=458836 RepID=A0A6J5CQL3_9BURK|nr:hypothetical protein LMG24238_06740 [Paraburkholderia sediminicola]